MTDPNTNFNWLNFYHSSNVDGKVDAARRQDVQQSFDSISASSIVEDANSIGKSSGGSTTSSVRNQILDSLLPTMEDTNFDNLPPPETSISESYRAERPLMKLTVHLADTYDKFKNIEALYQEDRDELDDGIRSPASTTTAATIFEPNQINKDKSADDENDLPRHRRRARSLSLRTKSLRARFTSARKRKGSKPPRSKSTCSPFGVRGILKRFPRRHAVAPEMSVPLAPFFVPEDDDASEGFRQDVFGNTLTKKALGKQVGANTKAASAVDRRKSSRANDNRPTGVTVDTETASFPVVEVLTSKQPSQKVEREPKPAKVPSSSSTGANPANNPMHDVAQQAIFLQEISNNPSTESPIPSVVELIASSSSSGFSDPKSILSGADQGCCTILFGINYEQPHKIKKDSTDKALNSKHQMLCSEDEDDDSERQEGTVVSSSGSIMKMTVETLRTLWTMTAKSTPW